MDAQSFQHHLLKRLSIFHWIAFHLVKNQWPYLCGPISGLSILLIHVLSWAEYNLLLTLVNVSLWKRNNSVWSKSKLVMLYMILRFLEGGVSSTVLKQGNAVMAPGQMHPWHLNTFRGKAAHLERVSKPNSNNLTTESNSLRTPENGWIKIIT